MFDAGGLQLRRILAQFRNNLIPIHTYNLPYRHTPGNSREAGRASAPRLAASQSFKYVTVIANDYLVFRGLFHAIDNENRQGAFGGFEF